VPATVPSAFATGALRRANLCQRRANDDDVNEKKPID
jgi:hypothetical protein